MRRILFCLGCMLLLAAPAATVQQVLGAATDAPRSGVTFSHRAAEEGQQVEQTVVIQLDLKTRSRQGANILEEAKTSMTRTRKRLVTTTRVESGLATAARVKYLQSSLKRDNSNQVNDLIAGKSYDCTRKGEQVQVVTAQGTMPTEAEFKLVAENMDTLGRASPLAGFLAGKHVNVGQRLTVPTVIARRLLGMNNHLGEIQRFELTLQAIKSCEGRACAEFMADIEARRSDGSQMRLLIAGPMTIEIDTCRAVASRLAGPIGMSHSTPDPRGRMQLDSTGRMSLSVASRFKDATR